MLEASGRGLDTAGVCRAAVLDAPDSVPFFSQAEGFEEVWPELRARLEGVVDSSVYTSGGATAAFESACARWTGARYVVGVNSGTDALVLLLRACGLLPGDEVVVPAFSFVASASSVVLAGGRPAFADIDPVTYGIDPASVADAVTRRTRMVMPVHLFCQLADMRGVLEVAGRYSLVVVEDSAEAFGMRDDGVHAGLFGAGGVLSFFPSKTLGAIGDAGAVITDDPRIAETVAALRQHGRSDRGAPGRPESVLSGLPGVNSKMDDIQACVLLAKLGRVGESIARRRMLADAYTERLRDVPGIRRLPTVVDRGAAAEPVFYVYLIEVDRRDELAAHLAAQGVGTETYYPVPLHLQPCFAELGYRSGEFPHAEAACERTLALPLHPDLGLRQVDVVCDAVRRFFTGRTA